MDADPMLHKPQKRFFKYLFSVASKVRVHWMALKVLIQVINLIQIVVTWLLVYTLRM